MLYEGQSRTNVEKQCMNVLSFFLIYQILPNILKYNIIKGKI